MSAIYNPHPSGARSARRLSEVGTLENFASALSRRQVKSPDEALGPDHARQPWCTSRTSFLQKNALALDEAPNPKLYRISSGAAVCRRIFGDGRSQITSILMAGDLLGAQALIAAPSFDVIEALEPMSVQSISRSRVLGLIAENANIGLWLLWYGEREIRRHQGWLAVLAQGNALQRTAILLLDFYRRASAGLHRRDRAVCVPLTQTQIAEYLGLTLGHVSRALTTLRGRGAIKNGYGAIEIVSARALAESAAGLAQLCEDTQELNALDEQLVGFG
jgi:CRP/FNR family transcriptional regulator, anaerobic regulatory protein